MKQISLATAGFQFLTKRTRKRVFLDEMNLVVPRAELVALIAPFAPSTGGKGGRPPFAVESMLRIHFLQQWFGLSDPAMEEALHDVSVYCDFAHLDPGATRLPDETTILRFRHLLEENNLSRQLLATINATLAKKGLMLKTGTVVDATLIAAPSSTKNSTGERDPEMHQTKKGNQWHFGMKAHIWVDAESGLATGVDWHVAMRPGKRRALDKHSPWCNLLNKAEQIKASVCGKVEHPFRVIKCQFGFVKVRYKGLAKNTAQLVTLFALSNLWMARRMLLQGARG
jgi:IS5 family transposase